MTHNSPEIGDAIIAGIASGDGPLEQMSEIVSHLERAGFAIVPRDLLVSFISHLCQPVPGWKPMPDLLGMLTQLEAYRLRARDAAAAASPETNDSSSDDTGGARAYKLQPPFKIYIEGTQIADAAGHICSAENPVIAKAILAALESNCSRE